MYNIWENYKYASVSDIEKIKSAESPLDLYDLAEEMDSISAAPFVEYVSTDRGGRKLRMFRFAADDTIFSAVLHELNFLNLVFDYKRDDFWCRNSPADTFWLKKRTKILTVILCVKIKRYKSKRSAPTVTIETQITLNT